MRVAIIGGGVAGLSAAWRLGEVHEVEVFEREQRLGGHAKTVTVAARRGKATNELRIDLGFQLYRTENSPNLRALFEFLGVRSEQVSFTLAAVKGRQHWTNNGRLAEVSGEVQREIARFKQDCPLMARLEPHVSLRQFLAAGRYSQEFCDLCLGPLLSFWWVSRAGLFEIPAFAVAAGFAQDALSFGASSQWQRVIGGAGRYIEAFAAEIEARVHTGCAVLSIRRTQDLLMVETEDGECRPFDQVVIAADAQAARCLLVDARPDEAQVLGSIAYESSDMVLHRDRGVMPGSRALWSYANFLGKPREGAADDLHGVMSYWPPTTEGHDLFVSSCAPDFAPDPRSVIDRQIWRHRTVNHRNFTRQISAIQGRERVWFCGAHTVGLPVHEHALCSGLAVAEALGASYPFAHRSQAFAAYQRFKQSY